jgi:hypothetical protein
VPAVRHLSIFTMGRGRACLTPAHLASSGVGSDGVAERNHEFGMRLPRSRR